MAIAALVAAGCAGQDAGGNGGNSVGGGTHIHLDGGTCAAGTTSCSGKCVNLLTDGANCGKCGSACGAGFACQGGKCASTGGCPNGETMCGGACTDVTTDVNNCGACGTACDPGQGCSGGNCIDQGNGGGSDGGVNCNPGQMLCGGLCVDTSTDANNCGACGTVCPMGAACQAGMCAMQGGGPGPGPGGAAGCAPTVKCLNACNQGDLNCEKMCIAAASQNGQMLLQAVFACLDAACPSMNGGICDSMSKGYNAVSCGQCFSTAQSKGGKCAAQLTACLQDMGGGGGGGCPPGQTSCNGACTDTTTDAANCGKCGNACGNGQSCKAGACVAPCPQGQTACNGACKNLSTDVNNCGACGNACGNAQTCKAGVCGGGGNGGQTGCNGAVACLNKCQNLMCEQACVMNASMLGQQLLNSLLACIDNVCPSTNGGVCDSNSNKYNPNNCNFCMQLAQGVGGPCRSKLKACIANLP
jgi:hypothetical protein